MVTTILYQAEATAEGGRGGSVRTSDGRLDLPLDVPAEMGGPGGRGTNPEQLFAAGYAACFQSALMQVAAAQRLAIPRSKLTARVGIGPASEGGFGLSVELDLEAPALDRAQAATLMAQAHELCPYSRATRGNIDVALSVGGIRVERLWRPDDVSEPLGSGI
jgi:lipoyl-dependent peroxiredoxin